MWWLTQPADIRQYLLDAHLANQALDCQMSPPTCPDCHRSRQAENLFQPEKLSCAGLPGCGRGPRWLLVYFEDGGGSWPDGVLGIPTCRRHRPLQRWLRKRDGAYQWQFDARLPEAADAVPDWYHSSGRCVTKPRLACALGVEASPELDAALTTGMSRRESRRYARRKRHPDIYAFVHQLRLLLRRQPPS